jgi:hypothetical protein
MATIEVSASNFLTMTQNEPTQNILGVAAINTLALTHVAKTQFLTEQAKSFLHLGQTATLTFKIKHVSVAHYLDMHHKAARSAGVVHVLHNLMMWDKAKSVKHEIVVQSLQFTHSAEYIVCKVANSIFTMTDTAFANMIRNRTVTQTLAMVNQANEYIADKYSSSIDLPNLSGPNAPECQ